MNDPKKKKEIIKSIEDLDLWMKSFIKNLPEKTLILLKGDLGAGKTQWVKSFVQALGGSWVNSPSFAIHNQYSTPKRVVEHLDIYRLEDEEDLESTGFWDLFDQEKAFIVVEWADRLNSENLPRDWSTFHIEIKVYPTHRELYLSCELK